jgi:hypothetical protein
VGITIIATIIAYKGYQKAKIGLLSPMKSSVVNIQTELFVELVRFLRKDYLNEEKRAYEEIINITTYSHLRNAGIKFNEEDRLVNFINEKTKLIFIPLEGFHVTAVKPFNNESDLVNESTENYKFEIDHVDGFELRFGEEYIKITEKIDSYLFNPLIPKHINIKIQILRTAIDKNIMECLRNVIGNCVKEYLERELSEIDLDGVYGLFNEDRIDVNETIEDIVGEIREYLHIDDNWT